MPLLLFRELIVLIASAIGAWTDYKTGLINDWITLPLIGLGLIFNVIEFDFNSFLLAGIVFGLGFAAYYFGKIGGGDVKLFTGMALMLPFINGKAFVLSALFFASIASVLFYSIYYSIKYFRKGIDWKLNKERLIQGALMIALLLVYLWFLFSYAVIPIYFGAMIFVSVLAGTIFFVFEKGIRKEFFVKRIALNELEEDEVIAFEELNEKEKQLLELKMKRILGEKEKQKLINAGIKEIPVYRNMPKFGPFIFVGTAMAIALPPVMGGGII